MRSVHRSAVWRSGSDRNVIEDAGFSAKNLKRPGIALALDVNVDTTTPSGEMMANVTAAFAQCERRLISQRTKEALAQKKLEGVRLGRERVVSAELEVRAHALKAEGCHAPGGRAWSPSSLQRILSRVPA